MTVGSGSAPPRDAARQLRIHRWLAATGSRASVSLSAHDHRRFGISPNPASALVGMTPSVPRPLRGRTGPRSAHVAIWITEAPGDATVAGRTDASHRPNHLSVGVGAGR